MAKSTEKLFTERLILDGSKSKIFKDLPKNPHDLKLNEFYFLMDYISKINK